MKKVFTLLVIAGLLLLGNGQFYANETDIVTAVVQIPKQNSLNVDLRIQKELKSSIQSVYGKDRVDEIYNNILIHAETAVKNRPQKLKKTIF